MRTLSEHERDEIEAVSHYTKYILSSHDIQDFKIYECMKMIDEIGKKYVLSGIISDDELNKLLDKDDMLDVLQKFINGILKDIERIK